MITLFLTLLEGVRANGIRLETEIAFDTALDSVLAQYHQELFSRYNLLAIDSSYGTQESGRWKTELELSNYFDANLHGEDTKLDFWKKDFYGIQANELEVSGITCLTDDKGEVFRALACQAMQADLGITGIEQLAEWTQTITQEDMENQAVEEQREEVNAQIEATLQEKKIEEHKILEHLPTLETEKKLSLGLLNFVVDQPDKISKKGINKEGLLSTRSKEGLCNHGNLEYEEKTGLLDRLAFIQYLYQYFAHYGQTSEGILDYEAEYILCGKHSDWDNLNGVLTRLYGLREGANMLYLYSDKTKCTEAEVVAALAATLLLCPELTEPFKNAILLAWASAESMYEVRCLFRGKKVPITKTTENWHTSLTGILKGMFDGEENNLQEGLRYEDYLRVFLNLGNQEEMALRAMDLMEANIRCTPGNDAFRLDSCYVKLEAQASVRSGYGYLNIIKRTRSY